MSKESMILPELLHVSMHYVVAFKPSGFATHFTRGIPKDKNLMIWLRNTLKQHVYPIHRLDRPTSGIILFGLNSQCASKLGRLFANREVKKTYHCLVRGWMRDQELRYSLKPLEGEGERKEAMTSFKVIKKFEIDVAVGPHSTTRYSWVEALPLTGRTHQIRRHCSHLRHPILGDSRYGDGLHNRFMQQQTQKRRLWLEASSIEFVDPFNGSSKRFSVPPQFDLKHELPKEFTL